MLQIQNNPKKKSKKNSAAKVRLADRLKMRLMERIHSGDWPVETRIPSIRQLASEYQVAPSTVTGAIQQLQELGWIKSRPGSGVYVNKLKEILVADELETFSEDPLFENPNSQDSKVIHFLFHLDSLKSFSCSLYTEMLCLMQEEAEAAGARLRIGNAENLDKILDNAKSNNTAGIIYMPDINHPHDLDWPQLDIPHVLFSLGEKSVDANYVTPNNYRGGYLAAKALQETGSKMAYVLWELPSRNVFAFKPYQDRLSGFIDYCHINDLKEPEGLMLSEAEKLEEKLRNFINLPFNDRPGLMLIDDVVLNALEKFFTKLFPKKKLNEEFEIIFFQDFNFEPQLPCATISFCRRAFCREVINLLQRVSAHPEHQPISVKIPMFLTPKSKKIKK